MPLDPDRPDRLPQLSLWTEPQHIAHPLAKSVLQSLQYLAKQARSTTPYTLLSDAIGLLDIRPQLRQRFKAGADRALANIDVFLEMSRAYDVRGLRAFAADMRSNWQEAVRQVEGRPDAEKDSVALITIHASKGLEWPIVIPINMTGEPKAESGLMHDRRDDRFSAPLLKVEPDDYDAIKQWNVTELQRERVRLWYVAATRARDLLILPRHSCPLSVGAYARIVDLDLPSLAAIESEALGQPMPPPFAPAENQQTKDVFAAQAAKIHGAHRKIKWSQPSRSELPISLDGQHLPVFESAELVEKAIEQPLTAITGGPTRGTILHKLMEEVLNGETLDSADALMQRASELIAQLAIPAPDEGVAGISAQELAQTILRTLSISEIAALRPRLVAEHTIFGSETDGEIETIVSGIADAVAYDAAGRIDTIIDWKSGVEISADRSNSYRGQLEAYRRHTGARQAFLVLMTSGKIIAV